ncbi:LANO_0G11210g1_1 [Lachancea nothofagi CBS 11611]|uniref:LANO_0G11210g1_1 n=1 Tax=Lachancea nothofagi CBS 11611 TaxID=1266666 RepID=A0A1G4KJE3_9SACH|nr:LANO_0G11210g1_1 [Lachancea nothofagi CBS 11611]
MQASEKPVIIKNRPLFHLLASFNLRSLEITWSSSVQMGEDHLRKGQEIPLHHSLLAGCLSGLSARFVTAPLDTVKIRLQLRLTNDISHRRIIPLVRSMIHEEGLRSLWKGNIPGVGLYVLYGSTQFTAFSTLNKALSPNQWPAQIHTCVVGALAGSCSAVASYPFDVMRTRFIANKNRAFATVLGTTLDIWRHEGLPGFFKGVSSAVVSIGVASSSIFATYETVKIFCEESSYRDSPFIKLLASSSSVIAGVVSKTLVFPIDTVRKRLQIINSRQLQHLTQGNEAYGAYKGTNFGQLALKVVEKEGFGALYRGFTLGVMKSIPSTMVSIGIYEWTLRHVV